MQKPVITGINFGRDITEPVKVEENPDFETRWGWWAGSMNVTGGPSRAAVYATARKVANRRQRSVRIYANTGDGWRQVDIVTEPGKELCEWWPEKGEPATGVPGEGCTNEATLSIGASAKTNYHLCDSCADLPKFRRMARRGRLASYYA